MVESAVLVEPELAAPAVWDAKRWCPGLLYALWRIVPLLRPQR